MRRLSFVMMTPEDESYVQDFFVLDDDIIDCEAAARHAVREYLETPEGKRIKDDHNSYPFNWGDAMNHVPPEIWGNHGLRKSERENLVVCVNHDENL